MRTHLLIATSLIAFSLAKAIAVPAAFAQSQGSPASSGNAVAAPLNDDRIMRVSETGELNVHADRTADALVTRRVTVLTEAAAELAGTAVLAFVDGIAALDIVEAYTLKADGERIDVDLETVITRDAASGIAGVYMRDHKEKIVNFPGVGVGDTLVMKLRKTFGKGVFADHFSDGYFYDRSGPMTEGNLVIRAPKEMPLAVSASGEGMTLDYWIEGEQRIYAMRYKAPARKAEETGAVAPADREPRLLISTFRDYNELGEAYARGAATKSVVTPAIQALAGEITKGIAEDDRRGQAEAISNWVKRNVRYVLVALGQGRVVPNEASTILKNRYGDCKDHVALMQALLAARGIASEPVLINLGTAYTLPEPATLSALNHVMVFLPELNLYDDPTDALAAFGVLPAYSYDKPVVHALESGARVARTPAMKVEDHVAIIRTHVKVDVDGSMSGRTETAGKGFFATTARTIARNIQSIGAEAAVDRVSRSINIPMQGRFALPPAGSRDETFSINATFKYQSGVKLPLQGDMSIPFGLPVLARPGEALLGNRLLGRKLDFTCFAGRQIEQIEIEFAEGLPMPAPLEFRARTTELMAYSINSSVDGRMFRMTRTFESHVKGQVCSAADEGQISAMSKDASSGLGRRMTFPTEPAKLAGSST